MSRQLDLGDLAWLEDYRSEVTGHFRPRFVAAEGRFSEGEVLLGRFSSAIDEMIAKGQAKFSAIDNAHNEICVADSILSDASMAGGGLLYEPKLRGTNKTIDFMAKEADGRLTLVDVKTIKPVPKDRWEQYEKAVKNGWFPQNVRYIVQKGWLGGELWHNSFASRGRFLEYSLEFEEKLAASSPGGDAARKILMLCGEGFYWREDELEDFVAYYRTGSHRADDPFSLAEEKYVLENGVVLTGAITSFACLERRQGEMVARRANWNVLPTNCQKGLLGAD